MKEDKDGGRGKREILSDLFLYSVHGREACLVFIGTWEFHTEINEFFVMPFLYLFIFFYAFHVCVYFILSKCEGYL